VFRITIDGGCRANPGPGAWAFVIHRDGKEPEGKAGFLPMCSNNQAEYRAMEAACVYLATLETLEDVEIWSDSQLIVNQLNRDWAVKDAELRKYYGDALAALERLRQRVKVTIQWFRREENTEADLLCNLIQNRHEVVCTRRDRA